MTARALIAALLLAGSIYGCGPPIPPTAEECTEFPYRTERLGECVTCQMVWCNKGGGEYHMGSGLAVLWCEGDRR